LLLPFSDQPIIAIIAVIIFMLGESVVVTVVGTGRGLGIWMMITVILIQMIGVLPNTESRLGCQRIANTLGPTGPDAIGRSRTAHRL